MDKNKVVFLKTSFGGIAQIYQSDAESVEYWLARDLMTILGYERWENFDKAINRAMDSCRTSEIRWKTILVRSRKWYPWAAEL